MPDVTHNHTIKILNITGDAHSIIVKLVCKQKFIYMF